MSRTFLLAGMSALLMSSAIAQTPTTSHPVQETAASAQVVPAQTQDEMLASNLKGTAVFGTDGQKIGEISDLLIDKMDHVKAYLVKFGGFLGIGAKEVAIEPSAFEQVAATEARPDLPAFFMQMKVALTKDQIQQMASFKPLAPQPTTTGLAPSAVHTPRPAASPDNK